MSALFAVLEQRLLSQKPHAVDKSGGDQREKRDATRPPAVTGLYLDLKTRADLVTCHRT
jgi:hypothetical protein